MMAVAVVLASRAGADDRTGDARMRELWSGHGEMLHRYALRLTLGDPEAARDLVQETLLRAWQHLDRLETATLRRWLFTVARRLAIDGLRARSRAREVAGSHVDVDVPDHGDRVATVTAVRAALLRLPVAQRRVLVGLYYHDRTTAQVAALLGIPEGTVKSRAHHAMRILRTALRDDNTPDSIRWNIGYLGRRDVPA